MADWFIATEGVKVVKDSASLWPQIITAVSSAGAALGGVALTHHFTRRRDEAAAMRKRNEERLFITTELVFLLERYASTWTALTWMPVSVMYKEQKIPSLNFSDTTGDWRVLTANQIFRVREFEASQAELFYILNKLPLPLLHSVIPC